jgi:NTP pyrophosphatase (non-canonical NTP hydrolase)
MIDLTNIQSEVGEWARRNFPNATPQMAWLGVIEEVGELAHAVLKFRQGIRGTAEEHRAAMRDAVADATIFALHYRELKKHAPLVIEPDHVVIAPTLERWVMAAACEAGTIAPRDRHSADLIKTLAVSETVAGFDFLSALEETWAEVRKRDWITFPKNGRTE